MLLQNPDGSEHTTTITAGDAYRRAAGVHHNVINAGDTVMWVNEDSARHSATDLNGAFDTGLLAKGASASLTFGGAGTFNYRCTPHSAMRGTITIN